MNTLIELYDDRAIENVIGPEIFLPEYVIYLCPANIAADKKIQNSITNFFARRGHNFEVEFVETSVYKADAILDLLRYIYKKHPDLALDVTGGNDAMLFAAGMFCMSTGAPAFTYSRKNNRFYSINNAGFADNKLCELSYTVSDFFAMTGGKMRKGRVDNNILQHYTRYFDSFFEIFLKYKKQWNDAITFFQRISQPKKDGDVILKITGSTEQKGDHGRRVYANKPLMEALRDIGFLKDLHFDEDVVFFSFKDENIRAWLRDVGSVLELYMYKACLNADIFNDVISSAIVDWEGYVGHDSVSNEIDVVAARGVIPLFISCKACEVKTEALNELAILRDRFGGKGAKAAIVTTENCNAATRHRAAQLQIAVIDIEELLDNEVEDRLRTIMKLKNRC